MNVEILCVYVCVCVCVCVMDRHDIFFVIVILYQLLREMLRMGKS